MSQYDVVVVGAGIIGLNIAFQIARHSQLRIVVIERGTSVGEGSTGASSAVCRFRYSLDEVTTLARDGIHAYQHWQDYLGLDNTRASFQREGVLWMPGTDSGWARREHARMRSMGISTELLDNRAVRERFPALSTCSQAPDFESGEAHDCDAGVDSLFESEGGYMDPVSAAQDLVDACRQRGVELRFSERVSDLGVSNGRLNSVSLASGETLHTALLINAAGPWCRELYAQAGLAQRWNLSPTRIQVLHRDRPASLQGHIPITVDMAGGIYFRTQNRGQQLIVGSVREEDERETVADPDDYPRHTDREFELLKLHALHHRLPGLDHKGRVAGYCGLYTVNREDVHPLVGPTAIEGFWVANGFSGHGFKLAPAIGALIAQRLCGLSGGQQQLDYGTSVPEDFLSIDREPIAMKSLSVLA
ncbi:MAG: sarcosine oxidase subunit beta [Halieaceae bacterium]|jgi:sarcosine oxidase subunit beta